MIALPGLFQPLFLASVSPIRIQQQERIAKGKSGKEHAHDEENPGLDLMKVERILLQAVDDLLATVGDETASYHAVMRQSKIENKGEADPSNDHDRAYEVPKALAVSEHSRE